MSHPHNRLNRAERLFRASRYSEVIRELEPKIFHYRDNATYYWLLGMSYLRTGDWEAPHSYLSRCVQLEPEHSAGHLALAIVHLRRKDLQEALRIWLHVLEIDPRNREARRAIELARTSTSDVEVYNGLRRHRVPTLRGGRGKGRAISWVIVGTVVAAAIAGGALWVRMNDSPRTLRGGSEHLLFAAQVEEPIEYTGTFRVILTAPEISIALDQIGEYFYAFRDNLAMRDINRLLDSNASNQIKQRITLLSEYFTAPDFGNFRDNFEPLDVIRKPWLYNGCYVRWQGRVANRVEGESTISFDLLVGYQDEQRLETVVSVVLRFATRIENGMAIEVIGRITAQDRLSHIEGTSIRLLEG